MKKLLLSFLSLLMVMFVAKAELTSPYTMTMSNDLHSSTWGISNNNITSSSFDKTVKHDDLSWQWVLTSDNSEIGHSYAKNPYWVFGTASNNFKTLTISTSGFKSFKITKVTIKIAGNAKASSYTVSVTNGDFTKKSDNYSGTTDNSFVVTPNSQSDNLSILIETSGNGVKVYPITVEFEPVAENDDEVAPITFAADKTGTWNSETKEGVYPYGTVLTFKTGTEGATIATESDVELTENADGSASFTLVKDVDFKVTATKGDLTPSTFEGTFKVAPAVDPVVTFADVNIMEGTTLAINGTYPEGLIMKYTSNDESVVKVEGDNLVAVGAKGASTTITASWDPVDHFYNAGSREFTATIVEKKLEVVFGKEELYETIGSSNSQNISLDGHKFTKGLIEFTIHKGTNNSNLAFINTARTEIRFYSGNTLDFEITDNQFYIKEIKSEKSATNNAAVIAGTSDQGTITNGVFTPKEGTYPSKVTIKPTNTSYNASITVTYALRPTVPATAVSTVNGLEIEVPENVTGVKYYYGCGTETEEPTEWTEKTVGLVNYHDIIGTEENGAIKKGDYYIWYYVTAEGYNPSEKQCIKYTHDTDINLSNLTFAKVDGATELNDNVWVIVVYNHEGKHYAMGPDGAATQLTVTKSDDKDVVVAYEHQFDGKVTEFQHVAGVLTPKASASAPAAKASRSLGADEHKYENGTLTYGGTTVGFVPADNGEHTFSTSAANGDGLMFFATSDDKNTGVDNVAVDNANAPVEYYNLQGVRVENPAHGLYIKRQGNTAVKVSIK